jgi:two-component system OmpR family response regulator
MEKPRVLVVDDDPDFQETLVKRLERRELVAQGTGSGAKALDLLDRHDLDVVLLDLEMPGLGGIETLREIKKRWPFVEVILLTGHASVEWGVQGMRLGAFDYVVKPESLTELIDKIYQAYERKRGHEQVAR